MSDRSGSGRRPATTRRRIVAKPKQDRGLELDDRPFELIRSRDQKWLFALVPYGIRVLSADLSRVQGSIDLPHPRPSLWEDDNHLLWIGGHHLYKAHAFSGKATKVGTKLSGWVEKVIGLERDELLLGVGPQGEVLLERGSLEERFRRAASHPGPFCLREMGKERAVRCNGESVGHIIDLNHLEGYTQIQVKDQDRWPNPDHALVLCERAPEHHPKALFLAAKDGAVAWTGASLSLEESLYLDNPKRVTPLAMYADPRWLYVLREGGHLHRYLLAPPNLKKTTTRTRGPARLAKDPLPKAQSARLPKIASAMSGHTQTPQGADDDQGPLTELTLASGTAQGKLGLVWRCKPEDLEWENLTLGPRVFSPEPEPNAPNFEPTRHRFSGPKIQDSLGVDEILGHGTGLWVTGSQTNSVLERSVKAVSADQVMASDAILMAAMLRFSSGSARPGWLYWTPSDDEHSIRLFVWGDTPRRWTELSTPELREQKWARTEVFPVQVALRTPELDALPQKKDPRYARLSPRWLDAELFEAMAKECRQRLEVLW